MTPPALRGAEFYTLAPCRLADTRGPAGPRGSPRLQGGATRNFPVAGICGVPPTAKAIAANVTIVSPSAGGYLTVYPAGGPVPLASTINFGAGMIRANNAVLILGAAGEISIFCGVPAGTADVVLDVTGYFE